MGINTKTYNCFMGTKIVCNRKSVALLYVLTVLLTISLLSGCSDNEEQNSSLHDYKKISVLQYGSHPVIDRVVIGFKERVDELYGNRAKISFFNANFDLSTAGVLSKQMVTSDSEILVSITTPATGQVIGANRGTKPLVFSFVSEPETLGYTGPGSLANTTGLSDKVNYKRTLELIRSVMPQAKKIGYLLTINESNAVAIHREFEALAPRYNFEIITATVAQPTDIRTAAETLAPNIDLFLFGGDNNVASGLEALTNAARARNLPVFACDEDSVIRGAVAAVSVDYKKMGIDTANLCAVILGGADPNRMKYEKFTASRLILNKKMASILDITFPESIISSADMVVE